MSSGSSRKFRMGLIQLAVGFSKAENLKRALESVRKAVDLGCKVISLPECFNCPYGIQYFREYAEFIPGGETCLALAKAAKEHKIYLIGGSIPEKGHNNHIFNTTTVWGPQGDLLTSYRKLHLFDVNIPGGVQFKESDIMTAGLSYATFDTDMCRIGIAICYDLRFEEVARIYRKLGCDMIVYPGAFNMKTGPLHWEVLLRARAIDNQVFVAGVAPAQVLDAQYVSYGHSMIADPWGNVIANSEYREALIYADIDLKVVAEFREQVPVSDQRRSDMYRTINVGYKEDIADLCEDLCGGDR